MDETTLNDLLECSVCLERLDTSSKVLPCQHTFCRKCLEVIVSSHQVLRCPECRILVDVKVDDLPCNVLLMRILEGMKNSSNNQSKSPRNTSNTIINESNHSVQLEDEVKSKIQEQQKQQQQDQSAQNTPAIIDQNMQQRRPVPHAYALYDYEGKEIGDLHFKKGEMILLKRKVDINWLYGEVNGRKGCFPLNYVQIKVPLPTPQCIALYDFKMGPNEEEGCLTFKKGTVIDVLQRIDQNWAEGRVGLVIGIFPIAFVEMNNLAKHLIESGGSVTNSFLTSPRCLPPIPRENTYSENNSTSTSTTTTTSPNSSCSSNTSTNSIPSSPISNSTSSPPLHKDCGTNVKYRDLKDRRHISNILNGSSNLTIIQQNRRSAEILSTVNTDNTVVGSTSGLVDAVLSVQQLQGNPENAEHPKQQFRIAQQRLQQQQKQLSQHIQTEQVSNRGISKANNQKDPNLPWAYVALYPYKPRKSDELELKKGAIYIVTERCLDGWYKGSNWADKSGVFPGNYVSPLKSRDQQALQHKKSVHSSPLNSILNSTLSQSHEYMNRSHPPPELPPRVCTSQPNTGGGNSSLWTKSLGQSHIESLFGRKNTSLQQHQKNNKILHNGNNSSSKNTNALSAAARGTLSSTHTSRVSATAANLVKKLTHMKKSSPQVSQSTFYMDNPVFEDTTMASPRQQPSSSKQSISLSHPVHVRSGSCPSQLLQGIHTEVINNGGSSENVNRPSPSSEQTNKMYGSQRLKGHKERPSLQGIRPVAPETNNKTITTPSTSGFARDTASKSHIPPTSNGKSVCFGASIHRKTQSLDAKTIASQIGNSINNSPSAGKLQSQYLFSRESRFRCIVPYPPNSDAELELNVGDIVFVHRKQKGGWYKGTHARTNKTGLFPASFVEPDI